QVVLQLLSAAAAIVPACQQTTWLCRFPRDHPLLRPSPPPKAGRGRGSARRPGAGRAAHLANLRHREDLRATEWLMSMRSARTRRAYIGDLRAWLAWLAERGIDVLAAGRVHVDLCVAGQLERGAEASSVRRLSALSSFYRYCVAHNL